LTAHSPDPWIYTQAGASHYILGAPDAITGARPTIAVLPSSFNRHGRRQKADGHLLAAAPELAQALFGLMAQLARQCPLTTRDLRDSLVWRRAQAALRKATADETDGESSTVAVVADIDGAHAASDPGELPELVAIQPPPEDWASIWHDLGGEG